jgi:RNA polymerase sigma factor (sigma-70 family)
VLPEPIPPTPDPLGDLCVAACAGDLGAMRRVLDAVAPRVYAVARRVLGPAHDEVEDVAQEALIALVRALPAFRGECPVIGYAARIAVRTAVAARRRQRAGDRGRELAEPGAADDEASAAQTVAGARRLALLRELLAELPAGQGETLALRVVLGCSVQEIAVATGAPVNTVRSRLRLAKTALRERIEADPALAEELEVKA